MTDRRLVPKSLAGCSLVVVLVFLNAAVYGQSPRPRPRPAPAPARPSPAPARTGTLVAETDLACELTVDGQRRGLLETGAVISIDLSAGEHLARCSATADTEVAWRQTVMVTEGSSRATVIELKALLDAKREAAERLSAERRRLAEEEAAAIRARADAEERGRVEEVAAARARAEAEERRRLEAAEARKTPQERANDVIRRALDAMGGLDRIRKIQTVVLRRVNEDGPTTISLKFPGSIRVETTGTSPFLQVYSEATRSGFTSTPGVGLWSPTPQQVRAFFLPLQIADLLNSGLTYVGTSDGQAKLQTVVTGPNSNTSEYLFSDSSGLLWFTRTIAPIGVTDITFADYRDVQGLRVPFLTFSNGSTVDPKTKQTTPLVRTSQVTSLQLDPQLPDSLFQR